MDEFVRTAREGHVLVVTLNRPKALNALHAPACVELDRIWTDFQADPDLWIAIIHGEGRSFCAGHDLTAVEEELPASGWAGLSLRTDITKPLIAAVHGHAMGGGFEIALCCDLVIADETARFALSEPRVGGVAVGGGIHRLMKKIPAAAAMGVILTGRSMTAQEAERAGLLTELVPAGEALAGARRWAELMQLCAPLSLRDSKRIAIEVLEGADFLTHLKRAQTELPPKIFAREDHKEGVAAFMEKRKPVWTGR